MRTRFTGLLLLGTLLLPAEASADAALLQEHCATCHSEEASEGGFSLSLLGDQPGESSLDRWLEALDRVRAREMPPEGEGRLTDADRRRLVAYLQRRLSVYERSRRGRVWNIKPRRMNNREFSNAVRDALMIEDVGTHQPTDNLLGDTRHHGFDTHGETLGFSKFHLEEYIKSVRKIVDATVLTGERPASRRYEMKPEDILEMSTAQNTRRRERAGEPEGFDFLDPRKFAYFKKFKTAPATGWYRITIKCIAKDRGRYDEEDTGIYDGDPIRLKVVMGDRERTFDLPDEQVEEIELKEWLAAGTQLRLHYPTDGLRLRGNGNFKFQNRITATYMKKYEPQRYEQMVAGFDLSQHGGKNDPDNWHFWVDYWMGPRPRVLGVVVEGPFYDQWPPRRQTALLGGDPAEKAEAILRPLAERAWRRPVRPGELDGIAELVRSRRQELGDIGAIKEGIVAVLAAPQFLLLNQESLSPEERFASKLSFFLESTIPSPELRQRIAAGRLDSFRGVRREVLRCLEEGRAAPFLRDFPYAWLELADINFMAPDPEYYRHFHRKLVSDDMIGEVLHLFGHAVEENLPVPELLTADYSFINADLAKVYRVEGAAHDSRFRKHTFTDGRRGGLLGSGAFLTSTADSLSTSPIHRAVYVMENFLGIHPTPPPPDVEITEPDVRQAITIKEILAKHQSDPSCATCHRAIDPYGYAFENFGPDGSWRDAYTVEEPGKKARGEKKKRKRAKSKVTTIPIDASAKFLNGQEYSSITEFRQMLLDDTNRDRLMRCFVSKLLTYANGVEPAKADFAEIDRIVAVSAAHEYRIVDTIAAVVDSPLFREATR